jgi:FkbM family methyltransferase
MCRENARDERKHIVALHRVNGTLTFLNPTWRRARRNFKHFPALPPAATILDVGAFMGTFTAAALVYWHPAKVWLVEAQRDCAEALRRKFKHRPECEVVHCAIAATSREVELRVNESPGSSSLLPILPASAELFQQNLAEKHRIKVPAYTLDDFFSRHRIQRVDLMKVDIQGAERQLIQGGHAALRRVNTIYIEVMFQEQYSGAALFPELHELLLTGGFRLRHLSDGRLGRDGSLTYADALYIRPPV